MCEYICSYLSPLASAALVSQMQFFAQTFPNSTDNISLKSICIYSIYLSIYTLYIIIPVAVGTNDGVWYRVLTVKAKQKFSRVVNVASAIDTKTTFYRKLDKKHWLF